MLMRRRSKPDRGCHIDQVWYHTRQDDLSISFSLDLGANGAVANFLLACLVAERWGGLAVCE